MDASRRWAAGGHEALAHPCAPEAHQIFGWYCGNLFTRAGDERAAFHYAHGTARIAPWFWSYGSGNAHKSYLKQLKRYKVTL